jgi:uncharacterized protein (TIGR02996 family)
MAAEWQRLEHVKGSSSKFWETRIDGKRLYTRFGKIGTTGQTRIKDFGSPKEAQAQREKDIAAKRKEGYTDAGGKAPAKDGKRATAAAKRSAASNPDLEAAILQDLDDEAAYLVYGDWLQAQGDSRGELITLQAGLLKTPKDKKLRTAADRLLAAHADHFWGKLVDVQDMLDDVVWHLGFIKSVRLHNVYERDEEFGDGSKPKVPVADVLDWLLTHPSGRFLQELTVGIVYFYENRYSGICEVIGKRKAPALRKLFLGDFTYEETELNWSEIGDAKNLYKGVPNLRSLTLRSGSMKLGKIELPELRELITITGGMDRKSLKSILDARWPKLEKLSLQFGPSYECDVKLKDVLPILEGKGFPALRHLGLTNAEFTDELCRALPRSKILSQLEELDLKMGTMGDAGAKAIADSASAFAHLKLLNVHDNYLSDASKKLLKKVCKGLELGEQREDEDPDDPSSRYASAYE